MREFLIFLKLYGICLNFRSSGLRDRKVSAGLNEPCPVVHGDWARLPPTIKSWARSKIEMCQPEDLHIMDGSLEEDQVCSLSH